MPLEGGLLPFAFTPWCVRCEEIKMGFEEIKMGFLESYSLLRKVEKENPTRFAGIQKALRLRLRIIF
jgi:hypothetical protein